ncbi:FAD-dependent oxidoreductase [Candidatus Saccharibacteria bacterium]|nr:FAD-dependent oxidoreductase [Candidatus Saccharibacteria bacterium]MBQ3292693.1 FAD-dependent oxidoreductase [Candidatus Saccharibacteria bacterium]
MKKYDCIIIGAGIAGLTAAIYLERAGKNVLVLESKIHGGQIINTVNIENWPGDLGVSGAELMQKIYQQAIDLGAEVEYEEVIGVVNGDEKIVKTEDEEYKADAIIIATGTEPRKMSEKQTADAGKRAISYCATCDGALYKGKPVVVVGSGNTAKHEIAYLENLASKVYHIHHDDPIPEEAVAVFVAIGRIPNTGIFNGIVDLDQDSYIVASEDCKTSAKGIFVAGDCRTKDIRQLVTAAGDGAVAADAVIKYLG